MNNKTKIVVFSLLGCATALYGIVVTAGSVDVGLGSPGPPNSVTGAVAVGNANEVENRSLAVGFANDSNNMSAAVGFGNNVNRDDAGNNLLSSRGLAVGSFNEITKSNGFASGLYNTVHAESGSALGEGLTNLEKGSSVVGKYNLVKLGNLFTVGNGVNSTELSNALTVSKDGKTELSNTKWEVNPDGDFSENSALDVSGNAVFRGRVLIAPQGDIPMGNFIGLLPE